MKKLMTLLSAATVALGLYAYNDTGTSFEGASEGAFLLNTADDLPLNALGNHTDLWATNGVLELNVISNATACPPHAPVGDAPDQFTREPNYKYLSIKSTFGNKLTRYINTNGSTESIGNGLYFDSMVKFTAFDQDPTNIAAIATEFADAKIAVWVQTTEDESATNLYVWAGQFYGDQGATRGVAYKCSNIGDVDAWHRLTIKAIGDIYPGVDQVAPGFVVYVDGHVVGRQSDAAATGIEIDKLGNSYRDLFLNLKSVYPSLRQGSAFANLASATFDGQGEIDDVVFTATAPDFAKDKDYGEVNWVIADFTSVKVDGTEYRNDGKYLTDLTGGYSNVTFNVEYAYGKSGPATQSFTFEPGAMGPFTLTASDAAAVVVVGNVTNSCVDATAIANALKAGVTGDDQAVVTLIDDVGELSLDGVDGRVKIDLNGQEVAGITAPNGVWIYDSSASEGAAVGRVTSYSAFNDNDRPSIIEAGWFDDDVVFGSGSIISNGYFKISGTNTKAALDPFAKGGYEFTEAAVGTLYMGYLILTEQQQGPVVAEHPWYESPGAVVLAENLPEQTGNYVSAFHGQGSGNFLGLTYSTNPLHFDLFGVDGTNAVTTIHSVDAGDAALTMPGFRGVAISETLGVAMTLAYYAASNMYTFPLGPVVGGHGQKVVTKPSTYSFDAAAFSPDGNYLFSNALNGESSNQFYVKWTVSVDDNTGALALTKVGSISAGGRGRNMAYAKINGRDLVFALAEDGKVVVIDMTGDDASAWTAADLVTGLPAISYGTLCVSGVNVVNSQGNPATPHLTVATSTNNGATKVDVLNVYALTVPATGAVAASLTKSFDEDALTAAGFGDISDANRYGNTVYVTDDEATIYFARPDAKLYAGQFAYVVNFVVDGVTNSVPVFPGATVSQADPTKENYIFDGWFAPGAGQAYDLTTPVTQDLTLEARFTAAEAKIGTALYLTLQAAVDAAQAGDTVTVLKDCTIATSLSIAKNITVHNDYTIAATVNYAICIGATVSFEGAGKIERASGISGSAFCVGANETTRGAITAGTAGTLNFDGLTVCGGSGGNLIKLENGTVTMNGGILKDGLRGIKADADAGSYTSAIIINGGTITNMTGSGACAVMASAESATGTATVTINGGVISGALTYGKTVGTYSITIPGTSTAKFDADQSAFCAPGYETTLSDGWYVVGPVTYTITFEAGANATVDPATTNYTMASGEITLPTAVPTGVGVTFGGWTNETITTAITTYTPAVGDGNFTLYAKWDAVVGPTYPTYLENADADVKAQYLAWMDLYGADTGSAYEGEFLLNVAPDTTGATLDATAVSISGTTVTIDINRGNLNGVPYVKKASTVAGLATAPKAAITIVPADQVQDLDNGGRITLTGESGTTMFYQIGVQSTPLNQN